MESIEALTTKNYTAADWALYYKNVWMRNAIARTIDVQSDMNIFAKNPNQMVQVDSPNGRDMSFCPVTERIEIRKIALQDAIDILQSIDVVLGTSDITGHYWNPEFLKVSEEASHAVMEAAPEPATVTEAQQVLAEVVEAANEAEVSAIPVQDTPVTAEEAAATPAPVQA